MELVYTPIFQALMNLIHDDVRHIREIWITFQSAKNDSSCAEQQSCGLRLKKKQQHKINSLQVTKIQIFYCKRGSLLIREESITNLPTCTYHNVFQADLVADRIAQLFRPLVRNSLSNSNGRDASGLSAHDVTKVKVMRLQILVKDELRHLRCLTAPKPNMSHQQHRGKTQGFGACR
jgi:hypothetical protein